MTQEESNQARGTYQLENTLGGTCQDMEGMQLTEGHSLPEEHIGRNLSGHGMKATNQGHSLS